jgi:lysozyme
MWNADTLQTGVRIDSAGIYAGQFNSRMMAEGHGCYRAFDGSFYEGHWMNDVREGFGFMVTTRNIQTGIWRKGRFFGERMMHTSNRIYGIDISRYQHEKGRRRFGIDWSRLRITHLGRRIKGNISGVVDYPVRFVYIKSTQGTTIRNQYYASDYMKARRCGIPVGTYHFFSTVKDGRAQAHYYLDHTLFKKGDLPPVLDVEPSDAQIRKMGGTAVLLREMREWIETIERRLHVRPILYVNQRFINDHLSAAPDLMENYLIWIARYGEYKPGVHLALWQLSADSKVDGIQTDVDVNVFNGYEPQWLEFLREETIK